MTDSNTCIHQDHLSAVSMQWKPKYCFLNHAVSVKSSRTEVFLETRRPKILKKSKKQEIHLVRLHTFSLCFTKGGQNLDCFPANFLNAYFQEHLWVAIITLRISSFPIHSTIHSHSSYGIWPYYKLPQEQLFVDVLQDSCHRVFFCKAARCRPKTLRKLDFIIVDSFCNIFHNSFP